MSDRRANHAEREARSAWIATRSVGDHVAVFSAGEVIRCPGTKVLPRAISSSYGAGANVVCGRADGSTVREGSVVTVFVGLARARARRGGTAKCCPNCGGRLVVLEDPVMSGAA